LILAKLALFDSAGILEEVRGVELVVAEKFPGSAVEIVGTRFDGGVKNGGAGAVRTRR